ncbi:hypothetical protein J6590_035962 [Homalodisca vitripennis]|nr:hypothetical protein J6590_035962 [Homalodisca vitripennis]
MSLLNNDEVVKVTFHLQIGLLFSDIMKLKVDVLYLCLHMTRLSLFGRVQSKVAWDDQQLQQPLPRVPGYYKTAVDISLTISFCAARPELLQWLTSRLL